MTQSIICIVIFLLAVISYLINKIPMAVTSLLAMFLLIVTGCVESSQALGNFADVNVIMMASMFVIAAGLGKTRLPGSLSSLVSRLSKDSFTLALALYSLFTLFIAQLVPNAVLAFCIACPFVRDYCRKKNVNQSRVVFSVGLLAIVSAGWLPIGSGASSYITENTFLLFYGGGGYEFTKLSYAIAKSPMILILFLYVVFLASRIAPDKKEELADTASDLSHARQALSSIIFILVLLCLIFIDVLPISSWQVALGGAVLMVLTGVLKEKEATASIKLPMLLLYVGALTMGQALSSSGVITIIGSSLSGLLGSSPNGYLLGLVFFIIPFLLTQIMVDSSIVMSFKPVVVSSCALLGFNPIGPVILLTTGAAAAFLTPMAGPTVSLVMGSGGYNLRSQLKMSVIPALLICITMVFWTMTVFPA